MSHPVLDAGLRTLGLVLPAEAPDRLLAFRDLLYKWNRTYNLTALRDPEQAITYGLVAQYALDQAFRDADEDAEAAVED